MLLEISDAGDGQSIEKSIDTRVDCDDLIAHVVRPVLELLEQLHHACATVELGLGGGVELRTQLRESLELAIGREVQPQAARHFEHGSVLGLAPHTIPVVGKPGSMALLATAGEWEFFEQFVPPTYVNEVCARITIRGDKYRPVKYAGDVRCPVLMQVCEKDEIIPVTAARETEKKLGKYADARYYPIGHFDIYQGEHFEQALEEQVVFLKKHLSI